MRGTLEYGSWAKGHDEAYTHWKYPGVQAYVSKGKVLFRGADNRIREARQDLFKGTPLDEMAPVTKTTANDPENDFKKADVQQYFDMLVLNDASTEDALKRTKKQFHLNVLELTPAMRITSPELQDDDGNDKLDVTFPKGSDPNAPFPPDGADNFADEPEQQPPQDSDTNNPATTPPPAAGAFGK